MKKIERLDVSDVSRDLSTLMIVSKVNELIEEFNLDRNDKAQNLALELASVHLGDGDELGRTARKLWKLLVRGEDPEAD